MGRERVSERRACRVLGQARSTQRREHHVPSDAPRLVKRMTELASQYGRYGYLRITRMLRDEGFRANHKRVQPLWRREGLEVPQPQPQRGRLWLSDGSCIRLRPAHRDHVWSYDLMQDRASEGRPIRLLTLIDEYTVQGGRMVRRVSVEKRGTRGVRCFVPAVVVPLRSPVVLPSCGRRALAPRSRLAGPIAFAPGLGGVDPVGQPIQHGAGEPVAAHGFGPVLERRARGTSEAGPFIGANGDFTSGAAGASQSLAAVPSCLGRRPGFPRSISPSSRSSFRMRMATRRAPSI